MGELGTYKPFDWPRICDVCGNRRRISTMRKLPGGVWCCDIHTDERTAVELDRLNAKQKPYNIIPVPNAKPGSQYPDVMEAEEAVIINFVARMVAAGTRYESVISGQPAPIAGYMLEGLSWSARYLYSVITDTSTPSRVLTQAKALLLSVATQLMARQTGFGLSPSSTKANNAFFGGFLESGATTYVTEDTTTAGLGMLYAYRVFGTLSYIASARAAASYLRNVQAIGSSGTNYTSSDSAGTARLYTGSLASEVSTTAGFYSNSLFYPSALLALEFWNALRITDSDQSIGSTGTPTGFTTAPAVLLSTAISDLRSCWTTGITDSTATLINGLSATTPREVFNAYPAVKSQFTTITGTGRWEFADAGATTGTTITASNFSKALAALYAYEGATATVTTIDDWLRSFTSNPDFETADDVSAYTLARATTGTYDPTLCLSTLLLVRDADDDYAAIALNGSSLYDWGAFGILSPLWATRHTGTFPDARRTVFGSNQRFEDGTIGDGDYTDWITLRGMSGLTFQTAFAVDISGTDPGPSPYAAGSSSAGAVEPPREGLILWLKGDAGVTSSAGKITYWADQSGYGQDVSAASGDAPNYGTDTISGVPCVVYPGTGTTDKRLERTTNLKDRNNVNIGTSVGETDTVTVMAAFRPTLVGAILGGCVFAIRRSLAEFGCIFDVEGAKGGGLYWFYLQDAAWKQGLAVVGPDSTQIAYDGIPTIADWRLDYPSLKISVNAGADLTLSSAVVLGGVDGQQGFSVGNNVNIGGTAYNDPHAFMSLAELLVWDYELSGSLLTDARTYLGTRYSGTGVPGLDIRTVNDVARASMFGLALRQNPTATVIPS